MQLLAGNTIMRTCPARIAIIKKSFLFFSIILGIMLPEPSLSATRQTIKQDEHASPKVTIRSPSKREEFGIILNSLSRMAFYQKYGYIITLPDHDRFREFIESPGRINNSVKGELFRIFSHSVYRKQDYTKGLHALKRGENLILSAMPTMRLFNEKWGFTLFKSYEVVTTLYGPGGQFDPRKGRVIIKTTPAGLFDRDNPIHTIIHEMIHIGIHATIVKRYRLTHWEKERLVDLICTLAFGEIVKGYQVYSREDTGIDAFISKDSLLNLPVAVKRFQEKKQTEIKVVAIDDIIPNSQAQKIGLKKGDFVLKYHGVRILGCGDLVQAVTANRNKKRIELCIARDTEERRFIVKGGPLGIRISEKGVQKKRIPKAYH